MMVRYSLTHKGVRGSKGGRVEEKDRGEGGIKEEARRNINKLAYL